MKNQTQELERMRVDLDLLTACSNGDIKEIKYLLTSPEIINASIHDATRIGSEAPIVACKSNNIEILKYLFFSPDIDNHASLYITNNEKQNLPIIALLQSKEETLMSLLTEEQFKNKFDLNFTDIHNLNLFQYAVLNKRKLIIDTLVFDLNLEISEDLKNWLDGIKEENKFHKDILTILQKRNLDNILHTKLTSSSNKMKI